MNVILEKSKTALAVLSKWPESIRAAIQASIIESEQMTAALADTSMTDPSAAVRVAELRKRAAKSARDFESQKDALLRPLNDDRNEILAYFKILDAHVSGVITKADQMVLSWRREEDRRARAKAEWDARQKAAERAEADRILYAEEERLRREQEALEEAARLELAGQAVEAAESLAMEIETAPMAPSAAQLAAAAVVVAAPIEAPVMAPPVQRIETNAGTLQFTEEVDFEVLDPWDVPREFVKPPEVKRGPLLQHLRAISRYAQVWDRGLPGLKLIRKQGVR